MYSKPSGTTIHIDHKCKRSGSTVLKHSRTLIPRAKQFCGHGTGGLGRRSHLTAYVFFVCGLASFSLCFLPLCLQRSFRENLKNNFSQPCEIKVGPSPPRAHPLGFRQWLHLVQNVSSKQLRHPRWHLTLPSEKLLSKLYSLSSTCAKRHSAL